MQATHQPIRAAIIGDGAPAPALIDALLSHPSERRVIGVIGARLAAPSQAVAPPFPRLGGIDRLPALIVSEQIDELWMAVGGSGTTHDVAAARAAARELGIPLAILEAASAARVQPRPLLENIHPARREPARLAKRTVDIVLAAGAMVVLAPVFGLAALLVRVSSPGPVLFRHVRIGLRLRPFTMLKFRTMVDGADEQQHAVTSLNEARGIIFKIRDDPRTTRLGRFLRRTSLDELPQLWNVLRGDMSLVGPRPLPAGIVAEITEPRFYRRHAVLPGMTGRWQVSGRVQDSFRMMDDDLAYVDTWSVAQDLAILAATLPAVFRREGA